MRGGARTRLRVPCALTAHVTSRTALVQSRRDELTDSVMSLILHHHPLYHLVVLP